MLDFVSEFWPGVIATAGSAAFPFVTQIRKQWGHFDKLSATVSNILAGLIAACVLSYFNFERHSIHADMAWLPQWFWLILIGIALLAAHFFLILQKNYLTAITDYQKSLKYNAARGVALIVYLLAFAFLVAGFKLPLVRDGVYISFGGQVIGCDGAAEVHWIDPVSSAATALSPIYDGKYQFLFSEQERTSGFVVRVPGHEDEQRSIPRDSYPVFDFDLSCS